MHRLVRISPYDASSRRHTSFAKVEVWPDVAEDIEIDIDESDLRIDRFRASGAGGQHVQKNETAIRITHLPTGIVVSCQNQRSLVQNRETALKILKAQLFDLERRKQEAEISRLKGEDVDAGWGNQNRSYVLQQYRMVKDHRTEKETGNVNAVLDGDLDGFMEAYLRERLGTQQETGALTAGQQEEPEWLPNQVSAARCSVARQRATKQPASPKPAFRPSAPSVRRSTSPNIAHHRPGAAATTSRPTARRNTPVVVQRPPRPAASSRAHLRYGAERRRPSRSRPCAPQAGLCVAARLAARRATIPGAVGTSAGTHVDDLRMQVQHLRGRFSRCRPRRSSAISTSRSAATTRA